MSYTLYGIKTCSTVGKARKWLSTHHIDYQFHDFRLDGLSAAQLDDFIRQSNWETLLNKRSTTWKNLDAQQKEHINAETACLLMLEYPTLIKRPLLMNEQHFLVGFNTEQYSALL